MNQLNSIAVPVPYFLAANKQTKLKAYLEI